MELALGGYAGFHTTTPPTAETEFGVYWPTVVPAAQVEHRVVLPDGVVRVIPPAPGEPPDLPAASVTPLAGGPGDGEAWADTRRLPLGTVCAARSGDKGGNANVGVWARDDDAHAWLRATLTADRLRELIPEAAGLPVHRYELPNLRALNFVIVGLLGQGVASSTRPDPQAKGLGEYLRSRLVDLPVALLPARTTPSSQH